MSLLKKIDEISGSYKARNAWLTFAIVLFIAIIVIPAIFVVTKIFTEWDLVSGVLNDPDRRVDVIIDSFFEGSSLGIHPNDNTCTVWLGSEDLVSLIGDRCKSLEFKELP